MRLSPALLSSFVLSLAAGAAQAADETFVCQGPAGSGSPAKLVLTVQDGLGAPSGATYQWDQAASVPTKLTGLSGTTLQFHGVAPGPEGVTVADLGLNRDNLSLTVKTRTVGPDGAKAATLEGACEKR